MAEQIRETTDTPACDESLTSKLPSDVPSNVPGNVPSNAPRNTIEKWLGLTPRPRFADTLIGETLGAYRIKSILGQSTTSTVYLADRTDQLYSAAAAIKLLNHDVASVTLRQFVVEKYTLGQLNHPGIARLYDAGELADGRPYLVMEYVEGESLDRYCDNRQLGIRERIELFIKACSAVDCAHQQLVVHRDLKPGNILVTREGNPKLLDFGIAKWLDTSRLPDTGQAMTRLVDRVLTPEYASPEQIAGELTTTTSDIYTLGVVLYELLSGSRPYQLPAHDFLATEKLICIQDPTSPSQCLGTQPDANQQRLAELRKETPNSLLKALRGDLDAIVMRALRKEPTQRYESVEQFTDDLTRYLHHAPVLARQGNWLYYSKRFVTRHWVGLSAAAVFLVCTIAMATVLILNTQKLIAERNNAAQQLHRADAASQFWLGMFDRDSSLPPDQPVTAVNLLDRAAAQIKQDTQLTPDIKARLMVGIGKSYQRQSRPNLAIPYLETAVRYLTPYQQENTLLLVIALESLSSALCDAGYMQLATDTIRQAIELLSKNDLSETDLFYETLESSGRIQLLSEKPKEAELIFRRALSLATRLYGKQSQQVAKTTLSLANSLWWQNNFGTALHHASYAVNIYDKSLPETHPDRIFANYELASLLAKNGKTSSARKISKHQMNIQLKTYGANNFRILAALDYLSYVEKSTNNIANAKKYSTQAHLICEKICGSGNPASVFFRARLVEILVLNNEYKEAEKQATLETSLIIRETQYDQNRLWLEYLLAKIYSLTERKDQAIQLLEKNTRLLSITKDAKWRLARSQNLLAALKLEHKIDDKNIAMLFSSRRTIQDPENYAPPEFVLESTQRTKEITQRLGLPSTE